MTRLQVKLARFAELYGAGDIKVGLITGEYPNGLQETQLQR
jgi:hypothetical protein